MNWVRLLQSGENLNFRGKKDLLKNFRAFRGIKSQTNLGYIFVGVTSTSSIVPMASIGRTSCVMDRDDFEFLNKGYKDL